jgi:hypothetical protein
VLLGCGLRNPQRCRAHAEAHLFATRSLTKSAGQPGESERADASGHQGAHFARPAATPFSFAWATPAKYWPFPHRCGNWLLTRSAGNSKWELFAFPNVRQFDRSLRRRPLLADCQLSWRPYKGIQKPTVPPSLPSNAERLGLWAAFNSLPSRLLLLATGGPQMALGRLGSADRAVRNPQVPARARRPGTALLLMSTAVIR